MSNESESNKIKNLNEVLLLEEEENEIQNLNEILVPGRIHSDEKIINE